MRHRKGLYCSDCTCSECEKYREAIANGRNQGNAIVPVIERIVYTPDLVILNTKFLAPGLGLKYLECIRSHTGELIAKMWHREMPKQAEVVVEF